LARAGAHGRRTDLGARPGRRDRGLDKITKLTEQDGMVILITHRLASVSRADRIYVLDHGRIAEHGTHDQLMARNGKSAAMYRIRPRSSNRHDQREIAVSKPKDRLR
jgi:ABC-type multidrug transport system ATPase subunit